MGAQLNNDDSEIGSINITPLVDIILVLLIIFMVTANFIKKDSININLPVVGASDPNIARSVQIAITKDGKFHLEGMAAHEKEIIAFLSREVKIRPNMRVTLSADEKLPYGTIARMMGVIRKSGVNRIALSVKR
jgi:biopolymer transport protein ExbD